MVLVTGIIGSGDDAPKTALPPSLDGGALAPELQALHEVFHDTTPTRNKPDVAQFDVVNAYMPTVPSHLYYIKCPPGFEGYLTQSEDAEQFNTNTFLLRVEKNCYDGALDYIDVGYKTSNDNVHVHQEAYVAGVVTEAGFGGCRPVTTPLIAAYTAAGFGAPAGADPCTANTIDFPHVNGRVGYLVAHTMLWLLHV